MGKALKAVGTAIVIVGAIAATGGAALAFGAGAGLLGSASLATSAVLSIGSFSVSAGALLTVGSLVSSVGGALSQPKVSTAGSALGWVGDPNGPMHFAVGRIAVGGDLRHKKAYGPNDRMFFSAVTVLSDAGPIAGFEGFTANDVPVTFGADGKATSSFYGGKLWRRTQRGFQPEASYLASPSGLEGGATLPNWGPQHKLSGKAATILTMVENSKGSAYKGQQPRPREIIRGLLVYDWRQDSTYPGGAGSQRLNDPSTWTFSENPALWAAKWKYGLWEGPTGKGAPQVDYQVGGIGVTPGVIDFASLTELANIADTHGWKVAARPSTDDDKAQVLNAFLQAAGAYYIEKSGKMSCLHRAAPRVSVATVTAADTAGPIELDTSSSYVDRKNTGVPTYLSEADGWKMTALGEVSAPEWVTQDGGRQRSLPMTYSFVPVAKQAAELMCLGIANTREGISGRIPLKPYMQGIEAGSAFTITEPEFVLNGLKCLALEASYDATTGVHTVTFVSETDGKYAYAYGQSPTPPAPPALEAVDPTYVTPPLPGDWVITPRPPGAGGSLMPGFDLSGSVGNTTATAIEVQWWEVPAGIDPNDDPPEDANWQSAGTWPPTASTIPIDVQADRYYWLGLIYIRNQNYSERAPSGPWLAGELIAGDVDPNAPGLSDIYDQITLAFGDIFDVSTLLGQARTDIDAQGVEIAAARGGQPSLNSRIVQVNQARIDGDTSNAEAISLVQARTANTEADIIDLENALATETGARAQAISQVTAQLAARPNLAVNGGFELGSASGWFVPGGYSYGVNPDLGGPVLYASLAAAGSTYPGGPLVNCDSGYAGAYSAQIAYKATVPGFSQAAVLFYSDAAGTAVLGQTPWRTIASAAVPFVVWKEEGFAKPAGAKRMRVIIAVNHNGVGNGEIILTRNKIEAGPVCTVYSGDASTRDLSASVTEQSLAIIDLENQQALASWNVVAAATGGKPARIGLTSSSLGSFIALDAPFIFWGDNTVFDDATDTLQTTIGGHRRVLAFGAPFGASGNLLEWWGADSIALSAMTTTNGLNGRMTTAPGVFDNVTSAMFAAVPNKSNVGGSREGSGPVDTEAVTVAVSGASGPVTHSWVQVGGADTFTINSPTGASTTFTATVTTVSQIKRATFVDRVTDTNTGRVQVVTVGGAVFREPDSGGT